MFSFGRSLMTLAGSFFLLAAVAVQAQIDVPTPAQPAAGATDVPLTAHFIWRPVAGAVSFEIELALDEGFSQIAYSNNVPVAELDVDGLWEETTYYWHVRAIDSFETPTDWSATRSFRTIVTGAPKPTGPVDGATDLPVDQVSLNFAFPTNPPTGFDVMYAFSPDFRSGVSIPVPSAARAAMPGILPYDTVVYWRVRLAGDAAAGPGPWSRVVRFRTVAPTPRQLGECTPVSPANGITLEDALISSLWNGPSTSGSNARYHVQFSQDRSMNEVIFDFNDLDSNALELRMPEGDGDWFWRVRALATTDDVIDGPWSELSSFRISERIGTALGAPSLLLPPNGSRARGASVLAAWDSVPGAARYEAQIGRDTTFESIDSTIYAAGGSARFTGLLSDTTYAWRVRAIAADSANKGPWSQHFTFATRADLLALPGAPLLIAPADREIDLDPVVLFRWSLAPGASAHVVQISSDSTFGADVRGLAAFDSSASMELEPGRRWWWRVRGANDAGSGEWSQVWSFTTLDRPTSVRAATSATTRSMRLVPTPATSTVQLSATVTAGSDARLVVANMRGEMVIERTLQAGADGSIRIDLPLDGLATGVYRCRILSDAGDVIEAPLVISR